MDHENREPASEDLVLDATKKLSFDVFDVLMLATHEAILKSELKRIFRMTFLLKTQIIFFGFEIFKRLTDLCFDELMD